jgi:hypothetical protein
MEIEIGGKTTLLTEHKVCAENIDVIPKLQEKTAISNGEVTADDGYAGLSSVTVDVPWLSRIKYFENNGSLSAKVGYKDLYALCDSAVYDGTLVTKTTDGTSIGEVLGDVYGVTKDSTLATVRYLPTFERRKVLVEGRPYYGYGGDGMSTYSLAAMWFSFSNTNYFPASLPSITVPACVLYVKLAIGGSVKTVEQKIDGSHAQAAAAPTTSPYSAAVHVFGKAVNEGTDKIGAVLSADVIYPRGDVTFLGGSENAMYSIDDGASWNVIKDDDDRLVVRDVEHIGLKGDGKNDLNFGTAENISDIATLRNGAVKFIQVEKNKTIYVSGG